MQVQEIWEWDLNSCCLIMSEHADNDTRLVQSSPKHHFVHPGRGIIVWGCFVAGTCQAQPHKIHHDLQHWSVCFGKTKDNLLKNVAE